MSTFPDQSHCLSHQLPEDQTSPIGRVCSRCKHRLYVDPPQGEGRGFWESQPAAYTLLREPCFVYRLVWSDFEIRTLHGAGTDADQRSTRLLVGEEAPSQEDDWTSIPRLPYS